MEGEGSFSPTSFLFNLYTDKTTVKKYGSCTVRNGTAVLMWVRPITRCELVTDEHIHRLYHSRIRCHLSLAILH